jgi:AcrR family transcriptional regulator
MYSRGYEGTTLRAIAREMGLQVPSLYNYFTSKQELLFRIMDSIMRDLIHSTRTALATIGPSPAERLHAAIEAFVSFNLHHPHEAAVSDAEFQSLTAENRASIVRLRHEFQQIFDPLIKEGIAQGVFAPTNVPMTRNVILSACARTYVWYRPDGPRNAAEVAASIADYLVQGLLAGKQSPIVPRG